MSSIVKPFLCSLMISALIGNKATTIKVFHVFESFGTQTQELKNSVIINFDSNGFVVDSTIYSHTLPLNEKYVYVSGPDEGLKLRRNYDEEMILSYRFENDKQGNRISTELFGTGDSLYWRQYQKFDSNGKIIKRIRYNPIEARVGPKDMMISGFKEGLKLLSVGDKATLFLPYYLAYGETESRGIPAKSNLIFEVEIVSQQ